MKYIKLFIISLLINSYISELYKGIQSKCTKKNKNENIDGTLACLREEHDIYVPYFAINLKISQCHNCGERIWDLSLDKCPKCGCEKLDQLGRVTGYLSTTVEHFNFAKQEEFKHRVNHFKN